MGKNSEENKTLPWLLFHGDGDKKHRVNIADLPPPPPWRKFKEIEQTTSETSEKSQESIYWQILLLILTAELRYYKLMRYVFSKIGYFQSSESEEIEKRWDAIKKLADSPENKRGTLKGKNFRVPIPINQEEDENKKPLVNVVDAVNAAIYLRRPLLVTGNPGSGKTSLAYALAYELELGPVLTWAITARSNLEDALYRYDAIARLQDSQLSKGKVEDIGQYITLGPVGTAFLPSLHPRVLLIDEIDKSDINLPNDLLHLFEEGRFEIPELVRWADQSQTDNNPKSESEQAQAKSEENEPKSVEVRTEDSGIKAPIVGGRVCCSSFPIVIMTSNGERDFPPAFLRRCLRIRMPDPNTKEALKAIIHSHFQDEKKINDWEQKTEDLITSFLGENGENEEGSLYENKEGARATDQLLNAIYIRNNLSQEAFTENLKELLLKSLSNDEI